MPQFIVPIIASFGAAIGGLSGAFLIMNASLVANGLVLLGGLAFSASSQKAAKRKAREQFNAAQVDRIANISSTVAPRELVLGRVRKGGSVYYRASTGANKSTFAMLVAQAGHEIDAVEEIYLNDQAVTLDGNGYVQQAPYALTSTLTGSQSCPAGATVLPHTPLAGSIFAYTGTGGPDGNLTAVEFTLAGATITLAEAAIVTYQYSSTSSTVRIISVLGAEDQAANAEMMALFPSIWTGVHRARAVAYLVCILTYSETAFPNGLPVVSAVIRGAKVYDPRENRLLYSRQFDNAAWGKNACSLTAANATANWDGSITADHFTSSGDGFVWQAANVSGSTTYTFSVWLAAPTAISVALLCRGWDATFSTYEDTLENFSVTTTLQRFDLTVTTRSIDTTLRVFIGGFGTFSSGEQLYIGEAQLVLGSLPKANTTTTSAAIVPQTVWEENPALLLRHVYQHSHFGKATVTAEEDDRIILAANACDTATDYVVDGVTESERLYRAALAVPFGAPPRDVMDDLAQAMGGSWAFAGGQLYLRAGVWTQPVMALTEADLAVIERNGAQESQRPISISVHRERAQKFNTVNITIWDLGQDFKQVTLTPLTSSALVTRDGATLSQAITYSGIGYAPQALHVGGIMMRDARDPLTVALPFKLRAYPLELFDIITLTLSRYGWAAKQFMVMSREWTSQGQLQLTLKETAESIYTLDAAFEAQGGAANTSLPSPWYVPPVGPLTVTSGTDELQIQADGTVQTRMRVAWPALDDASVTQAGSIEVQYRSALSDGEWARVQIAGNETQVVIAGLQDGDAYIIRARARNSLAIGDWSAQVAHQILGKSEPPPDVDSLAINGLVLSWPAVSAVDLAGYKLRAIAGVVSNWAGGFALHDGVVTDPPYVLPAPLGGLYTYMVVAVDTSGNTSALPASVTATSSYSLAGNTLESWPQAPLFEGSISGGTVVADQLVADATGSLFWGADTNLHWATDTAALYWGATSYSAMSYVCSLGPSAAGLLVLDSAIAGDVVAIDMRRNDAALFWTADASPFWTSDPALVWTAASGPWVPWPGALAVVAGEYIELRVSTSAGATQGVITSFTPYLDVPTVEDYIDNAVVGAAGTRLSLAQTFRAIRNIQLTVQQDGGSAVTARWMDKLATGPLVQVLDISGNPVPGTVDAYLKGY